MGYFPMLKKLRLLLWLLRLLRLFWLLRPDLGLLRNEKHANQVSQQGGTTREKAKDHPKQAQRRGIDVKIFTEASADATDFFV